MEDIGDIIAWKVFYFDNFLYVIFWAHYFINTPLQINMNIYSYLIRQSFWGCRCKSNISLYKWRVTGNTSTVTLWCFEQVRQVGQIPQLVEDAAEDKNDEDVEILDPETVNLVCIHSYILSSFLSSFHSFILSCILIFIISFFQSFIL